MAFIPSFSVDALRAMADTAMVTDEDARAHVRRGTMRSHAEAFSQTSFHRQLIQALADPYTRHGRTTRTAVEPTTRQTYEYDPSPALRNASGTVEDGVVSDRSAVLDARYSMGLNDDAYLNAPVLPLQSMVSAMSDDRTRRLGGVLEPAFELAQQKGVVDACLSNVDERARRAAAAASEAFALAGWLLSIDEIAMYCAAALEYLATSGRDGDRERKHAPAAQELLETCRKNPAAAASALRTFDETNADELHRRCLLLRLVLALFGVPLDNALLHEQAALSQVRGFQNAIKNLVVAASSIPDVLSSMQTDATVSPAPADAFGCDPRDDKNDDSSLLSSVESVDVIVDALCAATAQMTEALENFDALSPKPDVELGVSAAWKNVAIPAEVRARTPDRDTRRARWTNRLSLRGQPIDPYPFDELPGKIAKLAQEQSVAGLPDLSDLSGDDNAVVAYALARGLCGRRGVHQSERFPEWEKVQVRFEVDPRLKDAREPTSETGNFSRKQLLSDATRAYWGKRNDTAQLDNPASTLAILCAERVQALDALAAEAERVRAEDERLAYNLPRAPWPSTLALSAADATQPTTQYDPKKLAQRLKVDVRMPASGEIGDLHPDKRAATPTADEARVAQWAPVKPAPAPIGSVAPTPATRPVYTADGGPMAVAISSASMWEHVKAHAVRRADEQDQELGHRALAAAAKLMQLRHVATVAKLLDDEQTPCTPRRTVVVGDGYERRTYTFLTRPALSCGGGAKAQVLYPCDAGLAVVAYQPGTDNEARPTLKEDALFTTDAINAGAAKADGSGRNEITRKLATSGLRRALSGAPLYLAEVPPGVGLDQGTLQRRALQPTGAVALYPRDDATRAINPDAVAAEALEGLLQAGVVACEQLDSLQTERTTLEAERESLGHGAHVAGLDEADVSARRRRQTVWGDGLREAALAGDRLYAFARQLGGAIGEPISEVAEVDDNRLATESRDARKQRARAAERAATQHMQLVRDVLEQVLKSSDLTLAIGADGAMPGLDNVKVVSGTLRKEARELSNLKQGGSSSDRFFGNAVALEQLLAAGTGEMTFGDLIARLRDAGIAMQNAVLSTASGEGAVAPGTTTEFLSAPRNSLMLRWKPEAHSAIREAFAIFSGEMRARHPYTRMNPIHAYELIEGKDMELCTLFATLCGVKMANSRIYSSSSAAYVGAFAAAANAQQMRVTLAKLCRRACEYLRSGSAMGGSREAYHG